jgi:hypothetical protein
MEEKIKNADNINLLKMKVDLNNISQFTGNTKSPYTKYTATCKIKQTE